MFSLSTLAVGGRIVVGGERGIEYYLLLGGPPLSSPLRSCVVVDTVGCAGSEGGCNLSSVAQMSWMYRGVLWGKSAGK